MARFSLYLRRLEEFQNAGVRTVSSGQLGEALGITHTQVRKDLAYLGNLGHRGVGYPTDDLDHGPAATLGVDRSWSVVLAGVGSLALALLCATTVSNAQGFHIICAFSTRTRPKIGQSVDGLVVQAPGSPPPSLPRTDLWAPTGTCN